MSQLGYLAGSAVSLLNEADPRAISATLAWRLGDLAGDGKEVRRAKLSADDVRSRRPELAGFVADLLLLHLLAVCQLRLASKAGFKPTDQAPNIETLVQKLGGTPKAQPKPWWFKNIVLLAVVRNSFVHGIGVVQLPNSRLTNAGWSQTELLGEPCLKSRNYADILRFKRAVRTALNELKC